MLDFESAFKAADEGLLPARLVRLIEVAGMAETVASNSAINWGENTLDCIDDGEAPSEAAFAVFMALPDVEKRECQESGCLKVFWRTFQDTQAHHRVVELTTEPVTAQERGVKMINANQTGRGRKKPPEFFTLCVDGGDIQVDLSQEDVKKHFGEQVYVVRSRKMITWTAVFEATNKRQSVYDNLKNGRGRLSEELLAATAHVLQVDSSELLPSGATESVAEQAASTESDAVQAAKDVAEVDLPGEDLAETIDLPTQDAVMQTEEVVQPVKSEETTVLSVEPKGSLGDTSDQTPDKVEIKSDDLIDWHGLFFELAKQEVFPVQDAFFLLQQHTSGMLELDWKAYVLAALSSAADGKFAFDSIEVNSGLKNVLESLTFLQGLYILKLIDESAAAKAELTS